MPVYEYVCDEGHEFEVEQPISAPALRRCTVENSEPAPDVAEAWVCDAPCRRLIPRAGGFRLAGGGWTGPGRVTR